MLLNLIITGVGGQGNVLASRILGRTAVIKGLKVTIGETFGLSQRGGPVMSQVRLSDKGNYGPLIPPSEAHIILGLEPLETLRVVPGYGNDATLFIVNSRPIHPLNVISGDVKYPQLEKLKLDLESLGSRVFWFEATKIAVELGGPIMLNMIMVGALCTLSAFPLEIEDVKEALGHIFDASKLKTNEKAIDAGRRLMDEYDY